MSYLKELEEQNEQLQKKLSDTQKDLEFALKWVRQKLKFTYIVGVDVECSDGDLVSKSQIITRQHFKELLFVESKFIDSPEKYFSFITNNLPFDFRKPDRACYYNLMFSIESSKHQEIGGIFFKSEKSYNICYDMKKKMIMKYWDGTFSLNTGWAL